MNDYINNEIVMLDPETMDPIAIFDKVVTAVKYLYGNECNTKKYISPISAVLRGAINTYLGYTFTYVSYFTHKPDKLKGIKKYKLNDMREVISYEG